MSDMGGIGAGSMQEAGRKMQAHVNEGEARRRGSSKDAHHEPSSTHDLARRALVAAVVMAALVALVVFLAVTPNDCYTRDFSLQGGERICEGRLAFEYRESSAGVFQAIGAALLVGSFVGLFTWTIVAPTGTVRSAFRFVLSLLLVLAIPVTALSFTYLFIIGPTLSLLLLWLMWRRR